jgi:hypothetical protein
VDQLAKSAEAYQGSALGWLRSRVPDRYLKAQEAYKQRAVDFFYSIKVDDAVAFVKEKSAQGFKIVTEARAGLGRARLPSPGAQLPCPFPANRFAALQAPSVVYTKSKDTLQKATDVVMKTVTDVWTTVKQSASGVLHADPATHWR